MSSHLEIDTPRVNIMNTISGLKRYACHRCSKSYSRRYNLRRHEENAHVAGESKMDDIDDDRNIRTFRSANSNVEDYQPGFKRRRCQDSEIDSSGTESTIDGDGTESKDDGDDLEESDDESEEETDDDLSEEDGSSSELEDNIAYQDWLKEAKEATKDMWNEKHEKYIDNGMDEDEAEDKANRKTCWAVKRIFFDNYKDFLSSYLHLEENETHQVILADLKEKLDKGMEVDKSLDRVMAKHHADFFGLFQHDESGRQHGRW